MSRDSTDFEAKAAYLGLHSEATEPCAGVLALEGSRLDWTPKPSLIEPWGKPRKPFQIDIWTIAGSSPVARRGPPGAEVVFGRVRSNAGHWHLVDSGGVTYRLRGAAWGKCPSGFTSVGRNFQPNGFWLCVRNDLAGNRFYVGNVVGDVGSRPHRHLHRLIHRRLRDRRLRDRYRRLHRHSYFRVEGGATTKMGAEPWSRCKKASRLVGQFSDPNGFWVCMEDSPAGE